MQIGTQFDIQKPNSQKAVITIPFTSLFRKNEIRFGRNKIQIGTNDIQFGINEICILFLFLYFGIISKKIFFKFL